MRAARAIAFSVNKKPWILKTVLCLNSEDRTSSPTSASNDADEPPLLFLFLPPPSLPSSLSFLHFISSLINLYNVC